MSSSAKSRNFRRRAVEDEDEDGHSFSTPTVSKINGGASTTSSKPSANKPKKPTSQPPVKSLLSFADDDEESPFSRPPSKPPSSSSSSRINKSSAHKLTSSKDRIAPHPPSTSLPSNVQPQAGLYTKEALLELQKNTKTFAAPARNKPKPDPEPVVILKGSIKPINSTDSNSEATGRGEVGFDQKRQGLSADRNDAESRLKDIALGPDLGDDNEVMPDQTMIDAIKAKRERLRQAKPAAPDYIALDGGSNHGEAEGLSDEEPEFQGRIGFFGEKIGGRDSKKGVFEDFEERAMSKERGIETDDDEEDEEDKMWEEEQVRKGLGKRLDDGVGSVNSNVSGVNSISVMHPPSKNVGGAGVDIFGIDDISISQQAEVAKKALTENLRRVKESHGRTMMSLAKSEENLSSSLRNVLSLEDSLAAAGEKFVFMQKLREFVSVLCEFLEHKDFEIVELEERLQNLHEERARAIEKRRAADNDDEISEIEQVIAGSNARAVKSVPVELDEFGRDVNLQKRMDISRRREARQRRRAKADSKRNSAMEKDGSVQQMEGELSTDESDSESTAYESHHKELLKCADDIFSDAAEEYSEFSNVVERFETWKKEYGSSYRDAYMSMSIPELFSPYVRLELVKWDPLHGDADFMDMKWHSLLFNYGENGISGENAEDDADTNLVPQLVEKIAIPILHHQLAYCWDILSTRETKFAVSAMNLVMTYVDHSSSALGNLIPVLRDRLTKAVADLMVPTWSPLEMKAVPNAARVGAYRFGTCVRLMRNICLWNGILDKPVLEKIALDELLGRKILPHLHSISSNVHDAVIRTERVIDSLCGVWTGPGVAGDKRKLQPLVKFLLLIGKTLEKRQASSAVETESGSLVRRLKKMLVDLNEYDHARELSRKFNLKEAL
ncbi:hypothetical protein ABFX02_05G029000 [Erythranthe guttata]